MVTPLDAMLTGQVAPGLRAAGFTRRGRRLSRTNELGDAAVIEISTQGRMVLGDGYRHFWISPWIMPEPHADLWRFLGRSYPPGPYDGVPLPHVPPPDDRFRSPWGVPGKGPQCWRVLDDDPADLAACGAAIAQALASDTVPALTRLLDRATLLDEVRAHYAPPYPAPAPRAVLDVLQPLAATLLPLLADAGRTDELAEAIRSGGLLSSAPGRQHANRIITWLAGRLAMRGAPELDPDLTR